MANRIFTALLAAFFAAGAFAAETPELGLEADIDLENLPSLQRGAQLYANYCLGCHSLEYARYASVAEDLHLSEAQLQSIMFTTDKKFDEIKVAMPADDSEDWFGVTPPNLTLYARSKGPDYLYGYLMTFYIDESRPWGVNNMYLPGSSMPHVLWPLQGFQRAVYHTEGEGDKAHEEFEGFEVVTAGALSPEEYERVVNDIVNFLTYVAEPARLKRGGIGIAVLVFLALFGVLAYALKKEYWKDVK
jgi:ubiquinol-cytochrome c reductase cytochrome c1 subunit